jgi:hypothetical protein
MRQLAIGHGRTHFASERNQLRHAAGQASMIPVYTEVDMRVALATVLLVVGMAIGCAHSASPSPDLVRTNGTVAYMTFEGGFWAIIGDPPSATQSHGATYDPLDTLPPDFRHQGLRVWFEGRIRHDMAGIHQSGLIVEILKIRRL